MRRTARDSARRAGAARRPSAAEKAGAVQPNPTRRGRTAKEERRVDAAERAVERGRRQESAAANRDWSKGLAGYAREAQR